MTFRLLAYRGTLLPMSLACIGIALSAHSVSLMAQGRAEPGQRNAPVLASGQREEESQILRDRGPHKTSQATRPVVLLRFAVQSNTPVSTHSLSNDACPHPALADQAADGSHKHELLTVDTVLLDKLSTAMQEKLSKKSTVTLNTEGEAIPLGALVISGCITRAKAGNSAKRLVGLNYGASRLEAHIVVLSKGTTGLHSEDSFDIRVKGGDLLPPLGPIGLGVRAVQDTRQNLSADAKRMANKVLKRIAKDENSNQSPKDGLASL